MIKLISSNCLINKVQKTIDNVCSVAGKNLTDLLKECFNDNQEIVDWFYKPNKSYLFNGKSPFEYCKEGNADKLEAALINLATGNFGS